MVEHYSETREPPRRLILLGYAGLLLLVAGRRLGGDWGEILARVGIIIIAAGAFVFLARLLVWRSMRR